MDHIKKSLKSLKSDLSQKENLLKTVQNCFPHLSDASQEELLAYFQLDTFGELKVYIETLSQTSHEYDIENTMICTCKDGKGEFKVLYETEVLAKEQADISRLQSNVKLKIYPCPCGYGWHLTKG